MNKLFILFTISFIMLSCGSAKTSFSNPELKQQLADKQFKVEFIRAYPQTSTSFNQAYNYIMRGTGQSAQAINLISQTSYIKIKGDSIQADLPFYGERYMGGNYSDAQGIHIDGLMSNYSETLKKQAVVIRFEAGEAENSIEHYQIILRVFENKRVEATVQSTQRSNISYSGKISD